MTAVKIEKRVWNRGVRKTVGTCMDGVSGIV